jgi:glyoxylase-like metal-dependent hydrolase (beta-lactamase superfamily II)
MKRLALLTALLSTAALAQQRDFSKVEIKATHVAGSVWMLQGAGGNVAVSVGDDGIVMVDDEFAPLVPKIKASLAKISQKPVRFVINTHWHFDHVGGNAQMADTAAILAHENVRKRMQVGAKLLDLTIDPAEPRALPIVTYQQGVSLWLNGEPVRALHVGRATPMATRSSSSPRATSCTWATTSSRTASRSSISIAAAACAG